MLTDSKQVWIGAASEVERALNEVSADLDAGRHFLMDGCSNMAFLHSDREVIVTNDNGYFVEGVRRSLYDLMSGTKCSQPTIEYGEDE